MVNKLACTAALLAAIPLAALVGIAWWFIRRDRAAIRDAEDALPPWK